MAETSAQSMTLDAVASRVDGEGWFGICTSSRSRIKLSGTPEELESFRYLQSSMTGFGYATHLLFHDAYISLPGRSRVTVDGREIRSITHSMSRATPDEGLTAVLVDVGKGDAASLAGLDLSGKILLVDGIASEEGRRPRLGGRRARPAPCQPEHCLLRDVRLAGLGQPVV